MGSAIYGLGFSSVLPLVICTTARDAPLPHSTAANPPNLHQICTSQAGPASMKFCRKCHTLQSGDKPHQSLHACLPFYLPDYMLAGTICLGHVQCLQQLRLQQSNSSSACWSWLEVLCICTNGSVINYLLTLSSPFVRAPSPQLGLDFMPPLHSELV